MKIVYCIAGLYNAGGMERVLTYKANYWVKNGHTVVIVTTEQKGRKPFFMLDERVYCIDLDVNYEENNGKSFINKLLCYPYKLHKHKMALTSLLKGLEADVTVSMFCHDASFLAGINDGSRKVLEAHFSRFKRLQYGRKGLWRMADVWRNFLDERLVRKFDKFVVLTQEDNCYWGNLHNILVIPNSIAVLPDYQSDLLNMKALAIGRYTYQKGFDFLIEAWYFVHRMQPQWHLDIVGEGEWKDTLQKMINSYNLQDVVHLIPPTDCVGEMYCQASIMVMSSRYEGLPMVLLEGASFGLPLVAFACKCGPADLVVDGVNGFLIPLGNIKMLAAKIILLMENTALRMRMGKYSREKVADFTEDKIMCRWEKLFQQLMTEKE